MAVVSLDASSCELRWSGEFEPVGISDAQAISFFEKVYRSGIGMIDKSIVALSRA